jgi:hypothetical protein
MRVGPSGVPWGDGLGKGGWEMPGEIDSKQCSTTTVGTGQALQDGVGEEHQGRRGWSAAGKAWGEPKYRKEFANVVA